jgi:hypothetical protein
MQEAHFEKTQTRGKASEYRGWDAPLGREPRQPAPAGGFAHSEARREIMATQKLEKSAWRPYFDHVSKQIEAGSKRAEIEVASLKIGDQIEAEWIPLLGISYDPKDDLVEVLLEGLDHLIRNPIEVWVDTGPLGLISMEVIDKDDYRNIVKLRDPLMLPYYPPP